jgi:hypothetical protein
MTRQSSESIPSVWRKSSRSASGGNANCVEVGALTQDEARDIHTLDLTKTVPWRKSSRSPNEGGQCVEVGSVAAQGIALRDSKDTSGSILRCDRNEWAGLLMVVKNGDIRNALGR